MITKKHDIAIFSMHERMVEIDGENYLVNDLSTSDNRQFRLFKDAQTTFEAKNHSGETEVICLENKWNMFEDSERELLIPSMIGTLVCKEDRELQVESILQAIEKLGKRIALVELALEKGDNLFDEEHIEIVDKLAEIFSTEITLKRKVNYLYSLPILGEEKEMYLEVVFTLLLNKYSYELERIKKERDNEINSDEKNNSLEKQIRHVTKTVNFLKKRVKNPLLKSHIHSAIKKEIKELYQVEIVEKEEIYQKFIHCTGHHIIPIIRYLNKKLDTLKAQRERMQNSVKVELIKYKSISIIGHNPLTLKVELSDGRKILLSEPCSPMLTELTYRLESDIGWKLHRFQTTKHHHKPVVIEVERDYDEFEPPSYSKEVVLTQMNFETCRELQKGDRIGSLYAKSELFWFAFQGKEYNQLLKKCSIEKLQSMNDLPRRLYTIKTIQRRQSHVQITCNERNVEIVIPNHGTFPDYESLCIWGHHFIQEPYLIHITHSEVRIIKGAEKVKTIQAPIIPGEISIPTLPLQYSKALNLKKDSIVGYKVPLTRIIVKRPDGGDIEIVTDGVHPYPVSKPPQAEWNERWSYLDHVKNISPGNWDKFINLIEGLYHEDIVYKDKLTLKDLEAIVQTQDTRVKELEEKLGQCFGKHFKLKPVYIGERCVFIVHTWWIVDTPEYGALYFFKTEKNAMDWAKGYIPFTTARELAVEEGGTYIIHNEGWEDEALAFLLSH